MRKYLLPLAAVMLTISPVLIAFTWHINNHGWPNDDAANYMLTAYQQFQAFHEDGSIIDGLQALYQIRGWRPIIFPVFATPFLWLFNGDVPAAAGATLVLSLFMCLIYVYAIASRYLDQYRASLATAYVGSSHVIAIHSTIFFAEITWLAFFLGFVFHLLGSEHFRKTIQTIIAGVLLGCAALIRPVETIVIVILPLFSMIFMAVGKKSFFMSGATRIMVFVLSSAGLLLASAFVKQVGSLLVLGAGIITLLQLVLIKEIKEEQPGIIGLNLFAVSFMTINLLWWADSMPELCSWVYNASFGPLAQITDISVSKEGIFSILRRILTVYLFPYGLLVVLMCLLLVLSKQFRNSVSDRCLYVLAIITIGLLFPMCILYSVTGTSDPRRVFVGMSFLLILISTTLLQDGPLRKVREIGFIIIVVLQLTTFLWSARGISLPLYDIVLTKSSIPLAKSEADQNEILISYLREYGVPRYSKIAVYTGALFQARDRIYEPAALDLAAYTTRSRYKIIYYWDIGDYSAVINRFRERGVEFLLIDKYRDPEGQSKHQPSVQFATALLDKLENTNVELEGLREIATFKLGSREQVLFEVQGL